MKNIRPILMAALLVGAFYWITTHHHDAPSWVARPTKVEITEAAGVSADIEEQNNIDVYKRVLPAVVNVTSNSVAWDFFYGAVPQQGQGSGFIIDKQGHILTNYHVIENARQLEVTLSNKKKYRAAVVGTDPSHDLAVIQIKTDGSEFSPATLGDSHNLQVGQKVLAIGNPFGLNGTMTRGIISAIRPVAESETVSFDEAIQTDAAINPGNSGGPLLDRNGNVIGINTVILSAVGQNSGIGFAIPINAAKAVLNDLVSEGRVRRPSFGIRSLPIGPELADQMGLAADYGILIVQVVPGGAADRAGLRGGTERAYLGNMPILLGGDLIVAIDAKEVRDQTDLAHMMNNHRAGDVVTVTIYRGKRRMDVKVTLGEAREQV